jgi:hypothetical protein
MARRNRFSRSIKLATNGKLANRQFGLEARVGAAVKRGDKIQKEVAVSTARRMMSFAREGISTVFNIPRKKLDKRLFAEITGASIFLHAWKTRYSLMEFGAKWGGPKSPGVTVNIVRGRQLMIESAFMNSSGKKKYGNDRYAARIRPFKGAKRVGRGPLEMLYGPSPRDMLRGDELIAQGKGNQKYSQDTILKLRSLGGDAPRLKVIERARDFHVAELQRRFAKLGIL